MAAEIAHEVDAHDARVEPPAAVDALESIAISARDDGLERENVDLLEDGEAAERNGNIRAFFDLDDRVRGDVLGVRAAVGVDPC